MSRGDKVEAINSFHSTLHSSDTSTTSQSSNKQPTVCEAGQKLSIPYTFISTTRYDGELATVTVV